jgi:hypothetical protein
MLQNASRRRAQKHRLSGRFSLVVLLAWVGIGIAQAQTTYTGGAGPSDFTLAPNWSNGAPLNQNAIVNTSSGAISLFLTAPNPNPYTIDSLTVLGNNALTFNQTSGTLTVTAPGALNFGTSNSIYNLSGGTLQAGGTNGITGAATLNLGGGTLQVVGSNLISNTPSVLVANTTSTINTSNFAASLNDMSGSGSLNKIGANDLNLGGTIVQGAGSTINSVTNLNIGTVNAAGTLTLNTGSSVVVNATGTTPAGYGQLQVGYGGTGVLNLSGGTIDMSTVLGNIAIISVGFPDQTGHAGNGTVNFSSGIITLGYAAEGSNNYASLVVGSDQNSLGTNVFSVNSTGVFNQSGGTVTGYGGVLEIGVNQGTGTYTLTNNASLTMGTGSTTYIGDSPGGVGLLHISGNSTYTDGYQTYIGTEGGTGTIQQDGAGSVVTIMTGGANVFFGYTLGSPNPGSTGNYDLSAGTLNFISGAVNFGEDATSTGNLNQTGGTLTADV